MHFSSGIHRVDSMKSRCRPDEIPMNGRSWSGVGGYLSIPLSYRKCTEKVLKRYRRATKKLLEIYQRGTKQLQAFGSFLVKLGYKLRTGSESSLPVVCSRSVKKADASRFKLSGLQVFCGILMGKDVSLVVRKKSNVLNALKCVGQFGGYRKAFRMSLACVFLVSMFSLSAQTPRKDSGADGLAGLVALKPGDKIPDAVWNRPLELNYFNGKKKTIKFAELKGKLILLDFWSTGCPSCIEGIPDMELVQQRFKDKVQVVMVNSKRNKDTPERINKRFKKYKEDFNYTPVLPTTLDDTLFTSLFPHNTLPTIAIIDPKGQFVLNSFAGSITEDIIGDFLKTGISNRFIEKSEIKNPERINTSPLVDTTGLLFCSVMSGYRENYLGVYPAVVYSKGNSLFQVGNYFLNTCYQLAFPDVFEGSQSSLFVFDDRINKEFINLIYDFKTTKGQFWYQLYMRDSITQELAFDYFRKALIERFHVAAERKKGTVAAYRLSLDASRPLWKTKGGMYINSVDKGNEFLIMQNVPLNGVISFIRSILDKPVIFESKSAERIDLRLAGNFLELSVEEKIAALEQYGIKLTPTQYNGEYPYFYAVSTQNTK
ncbi:TlpA disulfide reductase family protein [Sphingobacterium thalpophilum]|uniref:TlpA disulfide reductase family protein n=2 Tax=Sphingobacterium thalpophilum TaxID=259 RepID=A0ABV4HJR9_9SPHI